MTTTDSIWAAAEHLLRNATVPLQITTPPNIERETQLAVRWLVETPAGRVGAWNRAALEYLLRAPEAPTAQAAPTYEDSTPELHVGDSAFESWYSTYNPAHKSDKQRARDAYAAGMGDPLVTAAPAAVAGPDRQALIDVIAQGLSGTWHCLRVWEAWNVGTMSQDDFVPVDESDTPAELADAVLALLSTAPTTQEAPAAALPEQDRARGAQGESNG